MVEAAFPEPTDDEYRKALAGEDDAVAFVHRLHDYYADTARARRTPVELTYMHLGMASHMILKLRLQAIVAKRNTVEPEMLVAAQQAVLEGGGHDCGEWAHGLRCGLCGKLL